ncbi:hypothetical protein BJY16_005410 [Actinoplanes octamycinicus]|uniref:Uncharacterized protein n=1 Tax=Actinoplanes octamycinicus TaxID=135948 RepID=A0A7W7H0W8_9ACTN|nr:hypothetical protein [Actinoplanes octamycinicus]MBB4741951.1 hypothetical protein [Actinoplanes octamycinicus]GIE60716.1 hypothetical protein Aoc01nite_61180 [Actinoplanes octamycinicus]
MVATIRTAGFIALAALFLAFVVVGVSSWIKGRRRKREEDIPRQDGGGSGHMNEGSTPGLWDSGSLDGP